MKLPITYITIVVLLTACVPTSENPKYLFTNGVYRVRTGNQTKKAYLRITEDAIRQYSKNSSGVYDTSQYVIIFVRDSLRSRPVQYTFTKYSLDIDLISIPLKLRPSVSGFPPQLNATINGGLFFGRRADIYQLQKRTDPLGIQTSSLLHYGFSFGAFTGLGSATMNPSVTMNAIEREYDAVVIPFGITALLGYNNVTFGIATGVDHMFGPDRRQWIYKGKPWIGLTIGLNLN